MAIRFLILCDNKSCKTIRVKLPPPLFLCVQQCNSSAMCVEDDDEADDDGDLGDQHTTCD